MAVNSSGDHFNLNDRCQLTRRDELKYVAFHFTDYLVRNKFILKPAIVPREKLIMMYIEYQANFPSHVKSSEIIEALREAKLLKRKKPNAYGDIHSNNIEFKDQIFFNENRVPQQEEVLKPRFRILTNQNFVFKNKLLKEPEINGLKCRLCNVEFDDLDSLSEHCSTRRHFLRKTYRDNRRSFLKQIENLEIQGAEEFNFQIHHESQADIKFKNIGKDPSTFTFHQIEVLHEVQFITLVYDAPKTIASGEVFTLTLKARFTQYDAKKYPMVLEVSLNESTNYLDLLLEPKYLVLEEDIRSLAPSGPYQPITQNIEPFVDLPIISGVPLPKVEDQMGTMKPLHKFEIPPTLFKILNHGFKRFVAMNDADERKLNEVRELLLDPENKKVLPNSVALNEKNYVDRFRHLMWIEEHQMHKDIRAYNLKEVPMSLKRKSSGLLGIEVLGLLEGRPSLVKGDIVYVRYKDDKVKYEGIVHVIERCEIFVSPHEKFQRGYIGQPVDVEFTFNRYCLKISHRALKQIDDRKVASVLFPSTYGQKMRKPEVQLRPLFNKLIVENKQQMQAVRNIVNNTAFPAPYIIYGPPGTGKTATLVEAVMQVYSIYPSSKICVCAPSNAAADVVAERLVKVLPASHILRIYSLNRAEVPANLQICSNYNAMKKELYFPCEEEIKKKRIVIVTPITAGRLISGNFTGGYFDYMFIDEAGHALEIELIVPIIGLLTKDHESGLTGSLVLAGDPKQLGPIVRSTLAIKLGYDISLLERLMSQNKLYQKNPNTSNYNANVIVKLLNNYRSHEVILRVPNDHFYDGQLLTKGPLDKIMCACRWEELPKSDFPLIFHGVKGFEDREKNSPSYFNQLEVQVVTDYVNKLTTSRLRGRKVTQDDIGIIAPYRKQVQKIRQHLKNKKLPDVSVASVEEFQGQERLIIIISTVRSRQEYIETDYQFGLGFLRNEKRFNVAVTRAKALLIVIGNPDVLQCDTRWRALMQYCLDNKSYRGEKASASVPDDFDVNDKLIMDLGALTINADNIPKDEKPTFRRED